MMASRIVLIVLSTALLAVGMPSAPTEGRQEVTCPTIQVSGPQVLTPDVEKDNRSNIFFSKYFRFTELESGEKWLLVGGYGINARKGAAYFFKYSGGTKNWVYKQKVTDGGGEKGDFMTLYVHLADKVAALSSPFHRTFGGNKIGWVPVFELDEAAGKWTVLQTLKPPQTEVINNGMLYGYGIGGAKGGHKGKPKGDMLVIGARGSDSPVETRTGVIHIYTRDRHGLTFALRQTIYGVTKASQWADDITVDGLIPGRNVDPVIMVGAPRTKPNEFGGVTVIKRDANNMWYMAQELDFDEGGLPTPDDYKPHYGEANALYKDYAVMGGERATSPAGGVTGAAYVYKYNLTTGLWVQGPGLFPMANSSKNRFAQRLDIHELPSGKKIVFVGAWGEDRKRGASYFFVECSDGSYSRGPRMVLPTRFEDDQYGNMIAMGPGVVGIGAPKRNSPPSSSPNRGALYVYSFEEV